MSKRRRVKLHETKTAKNVKLGWKIRRQLQQEILQKKLIEYYLKPGEKHRCIERYPEAMQPMIKDFLRQAEKHTRLEMKLR